MSGDGQLLAARSNAAVYTFILIAIAVLVAILLLYIVLKKMKKTAVLINVARGPVVNNTALAEALESGEIKAAGLDVLEKEPLAPSNPLSKIKDSNKLIITPHLAWGSVEARTRCVLGVYDNIKAFLDGSPIHVVN